MFLLVFRNEFGMKCRENEPDDFIFILSSSNYSTLFRFDLIVECFPHDLGTEIMEACNSYTFAAMVLVTNHWIHCTPVHCSPIHCYVLQPDDI